MSALSIEDRLVEKLRTPAGLTFKPEFSRRTISFSSLSQTEQKELVHNVVVCCMEAYRKHSCRLGDQIGSDEVQKLAECAVRTSINFSQVFYVAPVAPGVSSVQPLTAGTSRSVLWESWAMARLGVSKRLQSAQSYVLHA